MIKEKIFRLHRHKSSLSSAGSSTDATGHKFDFTFSNIQALQVPKGWDKLTVSLISSESGKTARKSGKVSVKNGSCRWTETLSESIYISGVDGSKEADEYLIKFLVAMGSSRSGILGETTLNLTAFLSSESSNLVSLPLKKCNHGTILQVEVRCLTPKANLRDENTDQDIMENVSQVSDSTITKSSESYSGDSSRPKELSSRETSFSASVSYSFDSADGSIGRQSFSSPSDRGGGNNGIGRQDSIESNDSSSYSLQGKNQREEFRKLSHATVLSLQQNGCASKNEADDAKIQELEAEARMWEQNARKLAADLETLRKELSDQNLNMELGQKLTQKIDVEKIRSDIQKEFVDEIRFQKEANDNLSLQLEKTQESNIELLSVLQEMEETIEKQKVEIESLSANKLDELKSLDEDKIIEMGIEEDLKNQILKGVLVECKKRLAAKEQRIMDLEYALSMAPNDENLKEKIQELETDCNELTEENLGLLLELKELKKNVSRCNNLSPVSSHDKPVEEITKNEILHEVLDDINLDLDNYLSQRVSGLEAQLRYLTETRESCRLELQHSESQVMILENQIQRLEEENELQKVDMKHRLSEMQKRWIEAQEECTALSKLNIRLQAITESLIEEYNSLQKLNEVLREQKLKLQNQCMVLEAEARKFPDSTENIMKDETKYKFIIDELESKLRVSELERLRLAEENSVLHMQLQKVPDLQNEVLALRVLVKEMNSEIQLLKASFKSLSEDYEELKCERISMVQKISSMEKAVLEVDDCRRKKNALEEKILRLEGDLIARDALCLQESEMKNELTQSKIANSQLLMKLKHLEEELKQTRQPHLQSAGAVASKQSESEETIDTAKTEDKMSVLEAELQEIRERYLQISLKYAEVEAEREQLVMKLKALSS